MWHDTQNKQTLLHQVMHIFLYSKQQDTENTQLDIFHILTCEDIDHVIISRQNVFKSDEPVFIFIQGTVLQF